MPGRRKLLRPQRLFRVWCIDQGVVRLKDGLIFIHDLERFLSLDEEQSLDEAMQGLQLAP